MQQGEPGGLAVLDFGDEHDGPAVGTSSSSLNLSFDCHEVLAASQGGIAFGAGGQSHGDAAPIDHMNGGAGRFRIAVDAVPDVSGDLGDRGIEGGQSAQGLVAELMAGGAGVEGGPHQRQLQQRLLGP